MNEEIRSRIREEMARKGMSQRELAERLDVTPSALSQVLSGKRGTMPESLMDVLNALGLTLEAVPVKDLEPLPEPEPGKRGRPRSSSSGQDAEGET